MSLARTACRTRYRETRDAATKSRHGTERYAVKLVSASYKICKDERRDNTDNNRRTCRGASQKEHKLDNFNLTPCARNNHSHSAILPPSHVLTEVQTVKVVRDARAFVFTPEVTLLLVQSTAMRVSIHGSQNQRHASARVDEVPTRRHRMRALRAL